MVQNDGPQSSPEAARQSRRGFVSAASSAAGALLAWLVGVRTAEAAHGHDNFTSVLGATVHAENTGAGVALLGTNASGSAGGAGVRGERSGGTGDGVQGIRSGSGSLGHGVSAEHSGSASGHGLSAARRGSGLGHAVNAVNENTQAESHGVRAVRSGGSSGHGVVAERTGSGFGYAFLGVNETTAINSLGSFIRRTSDVGSGDALHALREGAGAGDGVRGERAGTGSGAGVHAIGPVGLQVDGRSKFSTVGSGAVLAGTNSATILNTNVTAGSHISVTLTGDPGNTAAVVRVTRAAGVSFTVRLSGNVAVDTPFTYFIVEPA